MEYVNYKILKSNRYLPLDAEKKYLIGYYILFDAPDFLDFVGDSDLYLSYVKNIRLKIFGYNKYFCIDSGNGFEPSTELHKRDGYELEKWLNQEFRYNERFKNVIYEHIRKHFEDNYLWEDAN